MPPYLKQQRSLLLLALIAAGLAGNYFKFSIFLNIDFLFGSIFAMLALQLLGLGRGVLAALVIGSYTYFLWNHPYATLIVVAETALVGLLMQRRRMALVTADAVYWTVVGMPLVFLFYHVVMQVPLSNTYIVMTKQAVNGIANAIIARLIFTGFALRTKSTRISFREIIATLLACFVLAPSLVLLAIGCRSEFTDTDSMIRQVLLQDIGREAKRLETWVHNRRTPIVNLAASAASLSPKQVQPLLEQATKNDSNFKRMGLLDRDATTTAFWPLVDDKGQNCIGKNYADRPFIPDLKRTLKPRLSEVVMARLGAPEPVVSAVAPVVREGRYDGYLIGVLSLKQVKEQLDKVSSNSNMLYTLLDKNGKVIMSNRPGQQVMTALYRGEGTLRRLDAGISQWVPVAAKNVPVSERWKNSFYVAEAIIGDLAEWRLVLEQPVAPFQKRLNDSYTEKLVILFVILLLSLALADVLSRRIMGTLENLRRITSDVPSTLASGGKVTWPESGITETSDLIANFKGMSGSIEQYLVELKQLNDSLEQRVEERTRQVERLASEQRTILSTMPLGACLLMDRKIHMANPAFDRIMGFAPGETAGRDTSVLYAESGWYQQVGESGYQALKRGEIYSLDVQMRRKDGSLMWCSLTGQMVNPGAPADGSIWIFQDITERKTMESRLRASESHYRLLTEDVADVVWKLDGEFRFTYISPADRKLRGFQAAEVLGHTIFEQTTETWHDAIKAALESHEVAQADSTWLEIQQRCKDGSMIWTEVSITAERDGDRAVTGYHGIARDITQRKQAAQLEQQLLHAQKLESLGVLAGGIAHDFNNILMAIMGNADLALLRTPEGSAVADNLNRIQDSAARAADLTKQMLAYSGKGRFVVETLDLNRLIEDLLHLLEVSISKKVTLTLDLHRPLPLTDADPTQLRQIVMNLVINASEAIGDATGQVVIATGCTQVEHKQLQGSRQEVELPDGRYVYLMVSDDGCGMDPETQARLFDPFFTTKFTGRGLGMAAVQGIVKGHKGAISIDSKPGHGSSVKVFLPAGAPAPPLEPTCTSAAEDHHGGGTVLLVDDEESVRSVGTLMLSHLGYTVLLARDGEEALQIFKETPGIGFVVLDLVMPRMDGRECLRELRRLAPDVAVIMSSGYNEQELAKEFGDITPNGFLQKPYDVAVLRETVARSLPGRPVTT
ncbi:PAS domain S-box protein [Geomonas azotofigens]|uniref:PAS domain S-box protein n=1 Tax=Geomonas azotofigens TaxID=2843196 RepID=UPI002E2E4197|nr:PAS domain S-box protein [Geomonas azotofigens]MBU5612838.1 PAS domain S-box protein [Geomonas azotofigens]